MLGQLTFNPFGNEEFEESKETRQEWTPFHCGPQNQNFSCLLREKLFPYFPPSCESYLSKYLTKELFVDHQNLESGEDYSFAKAIYPGVKFPE